MQQLKKTLLSTPIIGPAYVRWKRQRKINAQIQREYEQWLAHPEAKTSLERLKAYENKYQGERCFIIGNGPSLKKMDLSVLKDEYSFGANRIYLLFEELGFTTSFICVSNPNVIEQFGDDIANLPIPKFLSWQTYDHAQFTDDTAFYHYIEQERFHPTPYYGLWSGATVTFISMQMAYFMGFETVYLIGVDHSFKDKGEPHKLVVSQADDPNHFHPDYFGKGVKWQLPDLDTSEIGYTYAREYYKANGRQILDATVDGKLTIFPKVDFKSLF